MKVAIITDQHFGFKKGSKLWLDYFQKFYDDIFFPTLEKHGIDTILDLGDTFDTVSYTHLTLPTNREV